MVRLIFFSCLAMLFSQDVYAQNTPCSGKKGGISHCQGDIFICLDGSVSKSKKSCQNSQNHNRSATTSLGLISQNEDSKNSMKQSTDNNCVCRTGTYCVGPRGGRYCLSDSGKKSYLAR